MSAALPAQISEQRASVRLELTAGGRLSEPYAGGHDVKLLDISASGARISTYRQFLPGAWLYLTVGTLKSVRCQVRWARAGEVGVAFERSLHIAVLEHLAAANR